MPDSVEVLEPQIPDFVSFLEPQVPDTVRVLEPKYISLQKGQYGKEKLEEGETDRIEPNRD